MLFFFWSAYLCLKKKNNGFVVGGMYSCVTFETLCYTLLLLDINLFFFFWDSWIGVSFLRLL
jgi:hypothetical protein